MNGLLNILKPPGMTSHDVVTYVRNLLGTKVGHTGTLDPGAAGVLVITLGNATKFTEYLMNHKKKYRAEIKLGYKTDTQDKFGKIISKAEIRDISMNKIEIVLNRYIGEILQKPPQYSAIKYKGKKLYELARKGEYIDIPPRKVTIYSVKLVEYMPPDRLLFDVECSKGTYIRTLCNDIGEDLGCFGYMSFLLRTQVGPFNIFDSITLEELSTFFEQGILAKKIYPVDYAFLSLPKVYLDYSEYESLRKFGSIKLTNYIHNNLVAIYLKNGYFVGLGEFIGNENLKIVKKWHMEEN